MKITPGLYKIRLRHARMVAGEGYQFITWGAWCFDLEKEITWKTFLNKKPSSRSAARDTFEALGFTVSPTGDIRSIDAITDDFLANDLIIGRCFTAGLGYDKKGYLKVALDEELPPDKYKRTYANDARIDAAFLYTDKGWAVLPIYGIVGEKPHCSCFRGEACDSPGKHPITELCPQGLKNATTDKETLAKWFTLYPEANLAVVAGKASGFFVLDVDAPAGVVSLDYFLEAYEMPETVIQQTGGGGKHYLFAYPSRIEISNSASAIATGLDIKSDDGYILVEPSRHISGGEYQFECDSGPELKLAPPPIWLVTEINKYKKIDPAKAASKVVGSPLTEKIPKGARNDVLFRQGCDLRRRGWTEEEIITALLKLNERSDPPLSRKEVCVIGSSCARYEATQDIVGESTRVADEVVAELNQTYATTTIGGSYAVLRECDDPHTGWPDVIPMGVTDFKYLLGNRIVEYLDDKGALRREPAGAYWLRSPDHRHYERVLFAPDGCDEKRYYNLWKGFTVKPNEGDCSLYLEHIKNNICSGNEDWYQYLITWMADAVQNPCVRPGVSVVLNGCKGTGKGVFVKFFGKLFGQHYKQVYQSTRLTGHFNAYLKDALLLFADEAFWAGDKAGEGALKALITEDQMTVEFKGKDALFLPNYLRIIIASNEDWVVPASQRERRYFCLEVSTEKQQDTKYFGAIHKQMKREGLEALLYFLKNHDCSRINLHKIPYTDALKRQQEHSMKSHHRFWAESIRNGYLSDYEGLWPYEIATDEFYNCYLNFAKKQSVRRPEPKEVIGRMMTQIHGIRKKQQRVGQIRKRFYLLPTVEECAEEFNRFMGCKMIQLEEDEVEFAF